MYESIKAEILKETGRNTITDREIDIIRRDSGRKEVNKIKGYMKKVGVEKILSEFGTFFFLKYKSILKMNIEKQMIFRYIYLCTFSRYDGKIEYGNAKGDGKLARLKDLQEILKLSRREAMYVRKVFIESGLIIVNEDKTISVNLEYAFKGKMEKKKELKGNVIRMFEEAIRELYEKSDPREHKRLALLVELLPHINFTHNIICSNPTEKNIELVNPFTLKEVMEIAEYSNITKFRKELLNVTVNGELAMKITETKYGKFIYVNPRIFYKGNSYEDLKACTNEFKVKKQE